MSVDNRDLKLQEAIKKNKRKEYKQKWRLEGKCVNCGAMKDTDLLHCRKCANLYVLGTKRYREKNPDAFRNKYHLRKSLGICVYCGVASKPLKTSVACADCTLAEAKRSLRVKFEIISKYGGKCVCCQESNYAFLSLDHIHNDGMLKRKETGTGGGWYKKLRKIPVDETLQVMCYNCNFSKKVTGSCAHVDSKYFSDALIVPKRGNHTRKTKKNEKFLSNTVRAPV